MRFIRSFIDHRPTGEQGKTVLRSEAIVKKENRQIDKLTIRQTNKQKTYSSE